MSMVETYLEFDLCALSLPTKLALIASHLQNIKSGNRPRIQILAGQKIE
jgi:hypothetical protein